MRKASVRLVRVLSVITALVCATGPASAEGTRGRLLGTTEGSYVSGGMIVFQDPSAGWTRDSEVADDGTFFIDGLQEGRRYRVQYIDPLGERYTMQVWVPTEVELRSSNVAFRLMDGNQLRVTVGGTGIEESGATEQPVQPVESGEPVGPTDPVKPVDPTGPSELDEPSTPTPPLRARPWYVSGGTTMILGAGFNGDDLGHESSAGLAINVGYHAPVDFIRQSDPNASFERALFVEAGYATNVYTVPQRVDPRDSSDLTYHRYQVGAAVHWLGRTSPFDFASGASVAFGGIYDGPEKLELRDEGTFTITSFGVYGQAARAIAKSPVQVFVRLDLIGNQGAQDASYFSGATTNVSIGLRYR